MCLITLNKKDLDEFHYFRDNNENTSKPYGKAFLEYFDDHPTLWFGRDDLDITTIGGLMRLYCSNDETESKNLIKRFFKFS